MSCATFGVTSLRTIVTSRRFAHAGYNLSPDSDCHQAKRVGWAKRSWPTETFRQRRLLLVGPAQARLGPPYKSFGATIVHPPSSSASLSASAISSIVFALKNGSSGFVGQLTV